MPEVTPSGIRIPSDPKNQPQVRQAFYDVDLALHGPITTTSLGTGYDEPVQYSGHADPAGGRARADRALRSASPGERRRLIVTNLTTLILLLTACLTAVAQKLPTVALRTQFTPDH